MDRWPRSSPRHELRRRGGRGRRALPGEAGAAAARGGLAAERRHLARRATARADRVGPLPHRPDRLGARGGARLGRPSSPAWGGSSACRAARSPRSCRSTGEPSSRSSASRSTPCAVSSAPPARCARWRSRRAAGPSRRRSRSSRAARSWSASRATGPGSVASLLGTAGLVIVLLGFMLVEREALRDRLIRVGRQGRSAHHHLGVQRRRRSRHELSACAGAGEPRTRSRGRRSASG